VKEILRRIQLTKGQVTIVDYADYDELSKFKWSSVWNANTQSYYAVCHRRLSKEKRVTMGMHRLILGLTYGDQREGDHVNHDTLDNRRANLRITTIRGNQENRRDQSYYGVGILFKKDGRSRPFVAAIQQNGKKYHVGCFATAEEAQEARSLWLSSMLTSVAL